MCVLSVAGSLQVKMSSGTGSSGCFSFLAFFQAAKHYVWSPILVCAHQSALCGERSLCAVTNLSMREYLAKSGVKQCLRVVLFFVRGLEALTNLPCVVDNLSVRSPILACAH